MHKMTSLLSPFFPSLFSFLAATILPLVNFGEKETRKRKKHVEVGEYIPTQRILRTFSSFCVEKEEEEVFFKKKSSTLLFTTVVSSINTSNLV